MAPDSTSNSSSSILKDGKLKPGIYKIQNLYTRTYMDIHDHLREVCCRPATALEDGMGLVRPLRLPTVHVSDYWKWEVKTLGAGYSIQKVRSLISFDKISATVYEQR